VGGYRLVKIFNCSPACPATEPTVKKKKNKQKNKNKNKKNPTYLALLDVNEDLLKAVFGGDLASSHTAHNINSFTSASSTPCCLCGQAVNLFLKESECPKNLLWKF